MLRRGAERLDTELAAEPVVQAAVMNAIGQVFRRLSLFGPADTLLNRALDMRTDLLGSDHPDVTASLFQVAELARATRDPAADSLYVEAISRKRAAAGPPDARLANMLVARAYAVPPGERDTADAVLDEAIRILTALDGDHETAIASAVYGKAYVAQTTGDMERAEDLYRDALSVQLDRLGPTHPETLTTRYSLGYLLQAMGKYAAADSALQAVLAARREVYGETHEYVANGYYALTELHYARGDYETALEYNDQWIAQAEALFDPNTLVGDAGWLFRAQILWAMGEAIAGDTLFERLVARARARGDGELVLARSINSYGIAQQDRGDLTGAEANFRRSWRLYQGSIGRSHPFAAIIQTNLGAVVHDLGRVEEAEGHYREALAYLVEAYGEEHPTVGTTHNADRHAGVSDRSVRGWRAKPPARLGCAGGGASAGGLAGRPGEAPTWQLSVRPGAIRRSRATPRGRLGGHRAAAGDPPR